MIGSAAEDVRLLRSTGNSYKELKLESGVLLENVKSVMKQVTVSISALSCNSIF